MSLMKLGAVAVFRESIASTVNLLASKRIKVTQTGTRACVKYDRTSGKPVSMNIPYLPDNSPVELIKATQGYIDHEVGHLERSTGEALIRAATLEKKYRGIKRLANIAEDCMIESYMMSRFPGSESNLAAACELFIASKLPEALARCEKPFDKLLVLINPLCRAWSGQTVCKDALRSLDLADVQPMIDTMKERIEPMLIENTKRHSSELSVDIGLEIHKTLSELYPREEQPKSDGGDEHSDDGEPKSEPGEHEEGEDDGFAPTDEDDKEEPKKKEQPETEAADGTEDEDAEREDDKASDGDDEEGSDDDSESEDERGDGTDEEDDSDDEGGSKDEGSEEGDEEGLEKEDGHDSGESKDDSEDADSGDDSADSDGDEDSDTEDSDEEGGSEGKSEGESDESDDDDAEEGEDDAGGAGGDEPSDGKLSPEDLEKLMDAIAEKPLDFDSAMEDILEKEVGKVLDDADYKIFGTHRDKVEPYKCGGEPTASSLKDLTEGESLAGSIQKHFERAMQARSIVVWQSGNKSGKLRPQNVVSATLGRENPFSRRQESKAKDVVVELLVDCSGSMERDRKNVLAFQAAYLVANVLERMKIRCEVIGFTTTVWSGIARSDDWLRGDGHIRYSRELPLYMPIFKRFDESMSADVRKRMADYLDNGRFFENVDGECVEIAARRLMTQKSTRKVLMVFSDGVPACPGSRFEQETHLKQTVKKIEAAGVETLGVGIQSDAVKRFYGKAVVVNKLDELATTAVRELENLLIHGIK